MLFAQEVGVSAPLVCVHGMVSPEVTCNDHSTHTHTCLPTNVLFSRLIISLIVISSLCVCVWTGVTVYKLSSILVSLSSHGNKEYKKAPLVDHNKQQQIDTFGLDCGMGESERECTQRCGKAYKDAELSIALCESLFHSPTRSCLHQFSLFYF